MVRPLLKNGRKQDGINSLGTRASANQVQTLGDDPTEHTVKHSRYDTTISHVSS